jgi:hypothetical protein
MGVQMRMVPLAALSAATTADCTVGDGQSLKVLETAAIRPAGTEDGYLQQVPLRAHWLVSDAVRMQVTRSGGTR